MPTFSDGLRRQGDRTRGAAIDAEIIAAAALLGAVLVLGLATATNYALTVDEFNTDDYDPKALAWYTSGGRATIAAGLSSGLAIATRTGGNLLAALLLCAVEFFAVHGRLTLHYLVQCALRRRSCSPG